MSFSGETRRRIVRQLVRRYGNTCAYCKVELSDEDAGDAATMRTVDHLVPRARGGRSHPRNLVLACSGCNGRKGDKTVIEFLMQRSAAR